MSAARSRKKYGSDFAQRLRALRLQKNLSQSELADKAGLHFTSVSRYETGGVFPNADALKRISEALEVSGDYLLDGQDGAVAKAKLEDTGLLQLLQEVDRLAREDKEFFKRVMETLLFRYKVKSMAS